MDLKHGVLNGTVLYYGQSSRRLDKYFDSCVP